MEEVKHKGMEKKEEKDKEKRTRTKTFARIQEHEQSGPLRSDKGTT